MILQLGFDGMGIPCHFLIVAMSRYARRCPIFCFVVSARLMFFCLAFPAAQAAQGNVWVFLMRKPSCFAVSHVVVSLMCPRRSWTC